jgi:hypothetical protein
MICFKCHYSECNMDFSCSEALGRFIFTFNLKCVHILRNERMPLQRRYYRVYEKVELRIYKNDFKNYSSNRSACRFTSFIKATKIIIDSKHPRSIGKISNEMVKPNRN